MGGLKTLFVLLIVLPGPGRAGDDSLVATFASCAGRFSAELEHAWLIDTARSDQIAQRRRHFVDLLEASVPPDRQRRALGLRIEAKAAHARLLRQATFSGDADRARWAVHRARAEIAYCTGFLLES